MTDHFSAEEFRNVPEGSEPFGNVPNPSASFGNVPNASEPFRIVLNGAERKETHTLTVREAARMFEAAGVARTERSIVNWCQPNKTGVARLDAYFDPNERKYYLTLQSVELAIAEERAKAAKINSDPSEPFRTGSDEFKNAPNETPKETSSSSENDTEKIKAMEQEILDLKIVNRAKDFFIEQLKNERENVVAQLVDSSRKIGKLETKLLQVEASSEIVRKLTVRNDSEITKQDEN